MSNNAVGAVYEQIIAEVINSSRVDFEEGGVDESVLDELKKGWQEKLSQLEVASFPWDPPKDAPAPVAPPPTTAPPQPAAPYSQAQLSPQIPGPGLPLPGAPPTDQARNAPVKEEPYIKPEPGMQNVPMPPAQQEGAGIAAYRAAQHVRGQFGDKGAGSINAIQASATNRPAGQPALPQMPGQPTQHQQQQQQQYRPGAPQQGQQQQQQQRPLSNGQPGMNPSQTDGAGDDFDFEGVLLQRDADGNERELGRIDIDRMIHAQIAANAKSMEGGGHEAQDGVLTVNGKEYVFHKATGEYEW
ncbi:transcription factor IIA [Colletotrichum tofieldiae]|nr:transcription factor IIA [Colletotrichum tofieldiae]GKT74459.1 transcription factor IIA [Colletotrichum tofieldiae]GKT91636.1 transcription factor IIA [Colletotrichum tofieldiae]